MLTRPDADRWTSFALRAHALFLDGEGAAAGGGTGGGTTSGSDASSTTTQNSGDGSQGGNGGTTQGQDASVPKARFDEVIAERNRLRDEATKRAEADRKAQDATAAKQGEFEKLATQRGQELEDLKRQLTEQQESQRQTAIKYEVMLAAQKEGIVDPEVAYKLLDTQGIELSKDGTVDAKALQDKLKDLLRAKPYLATAAQAGGRNGIPGSPGGADGATTTDGGRPQQMTQYLHRTYGGLIKKPS